MVSREVPHEEAFKMALCAINEAKDTIYIIGSAKKYLEALREKAEERKKIYIATRLSREYETLAHYPNVHIRALENEPWVKLLAIDDGNFILLYNEHRAIVFSDAPLTFSELKENYIKVFFKE